MKITFPIIAFVVCLFGSAGASLAGVGSAGASLAGGKTSFLVAPYTNCFLSGCHQPSSSGTHPVGMKSPQQNCTTCHAPASYDPYAANKGSNIRPVHTPAPFGRDLFKGIEVCATCHETGMQNQASHPTLDCLKCHGLNRIADVHAVDYPGGEKDVGRNTQKNPIFQKLRQETGGHDNCLNCHHTNVWSPEYYFFHLDGNHLSTLDPTIIDPFDPQKSCAVCHTQPVP